MRRVLALAIAALLTLAPFRPASSQAVARAFSIFLDCSDFYCEPDFYRTALGFVDHVRERTAADVHVLITRQATGGGGSVFTLALYGQRRFAGIGDTISVTTAQGATEDEQRRAIARTVALGLARYLARTGDASRASLSVSAPAAGTTAAAPARDPWNAWVFRVGTNMNGSRENSVSFDFINGNFSASRVTEAWKTNVRLNEFYNGQAFTINGERVSSIRRDYGGELQQVKSLSGHWSAGVRAGSSSSTYLNQHLAANIAPTVEYDLYPYSESTRRQLTFQYAAGVRHYKYNETTLYFRDAETRPFESMNIAFERKETWGSVNLEADGYHFLDDLTKSRLTFSGGANVRIIKGLSLDFFGDYAVLHDQIYLPKGDATKEEVLLRQSQLATGYRGFFYMGISYTFGSVLNNVVNPRFRRNWNGD